MEYHDPLESFWTSLYYGSKKHTIYHTANTTTAAEDRSAAIKEVLDNANKEYTIIENIASAITDNELSSNSPNTYTDQQIADIIRQRYYPAATETEISRVQEHLEAHYDKVATERKYIDPQREVRLYSSRDYYNHRNGLDKVKHFPFRSRL